LQLYGHESTRPGLWRCVTRNCEKHYGRTPLGFIYGVLSFRENKSKRDALEWALKFLNTTFDELKVDVPALERRKFIRQTPKTAPEHKSICSREVVKQRLIIPSPYFLGRGFKAETLTKYDIGDVKDNSKDFFGRAVVPIYSEDAKDLIGFTARSVYPECNRCRLYHDTNLKCPQNELEINKCSKWRHSAGFNASNYFFNVWNAKENIRKHKTAVVVESPGDVLRLVESGVNIALGMLGTYLSDFQVSILDSLGVMNLIVMLNQDKAGRAGTKVIFDLCKRHYRMFDIPIDGNDLGSLTTDVVTQDIKPIIDRLLCR
jgi:hypothetical protein